MRIFKKGKVRVLVLTLYCDENEYEDALKMLKSQTYKNWQQIVFYNLPNKKAHDTLYNYIMNHSKDYDLFVKLDADMILKDENTLEKIVGFFEDNPGLDRANFSVHDVLSGLDIMGLLVFTKNVSWKRSEEKLFVDHTPEIPGKRLLVWDNPAPVALHSPNPNYFQAFHFGAHRALKAIQPERKDKRWIQSAIQWHLLMCVWKKYLVTRDRLRGFLLLGAYSVWRKDLDQLAGEYKDKGLRKLYQKYCEIENNDIYLLLKKDWGKVVFLNHLLYVLLWIKIIEYKTRSRIKTWLVSKMNARHSLARRL